MNWLFILLALLAGAALPLQAGINAQLRRSIGDPILASLISFVVGSFALSALVLTLRVSMPTPKMLADTPVWAWVGGLLGATYIATTIIVIPRLGVGATVALVIAGQILLAIALDHFGAVGLTVHPISLWRIVGAGLLIAGVMLIQKF